MPPRLHAASCSLLLLLYPPVPRAFVAKGIANVAPLRGGCEKPAAPASPHAIQSTHTTSSWRCIQFRLRSQPMCLGACVGQGSRSLAISTRLPLQRMRSNPQLCSLDSNGRHTAHASAKLQGGKTMCQTRSTQCDQWQCLSKGAPSMSPRRRSLEIFPRNRGSLPRLHGKNLRAFVQCPVSLHLPGAGYGRDTIVTR